MPRAVGGESARREDAARQSGERATDEKSGLARVCGGVT